MIRAFKSTLEDMEEKRSIHSLRTAAERERRQNNLRSTAAGAGGDISYIDEDGGGGLGSNGLGSKSGRTTRHTENQYLKVEGQTYRVQRVVQQPNTAATAAMLPVPQDRIRRCSDAQTQSNESSFEALTTHQQHLHSHPLTTASSALSATTAITNNCDAAVDPSSSQTRVQVGPVGHVLPHPQSAVPHSVSSSRNPSPVPHPPPPPYPTAFFPVPAPPSPVPAVLQAAYGYDPSSCQYLGQAADGYQYELVRRPSLGNPLAAAASAAAASAASELAVPPNHVLRRPSTGSPYPPPPHSPYGGGLAATSLHGSFDSCAVEAGTRPIPSPSAAAAVGPPLLVPSSHSPSYHHHHSSQHFLYHAPQPVAQPVLFTQQPPFQPASYQMYRHHSVSSTGGGGVPPAAYHSHQPPPSQPGVTPPPPPVVGHMQSAFRMVGDHVEATAASSELSMPKMIHETSI